LPLVLCRYVGPEGTRAEPNNLIEPEQCAVANFSQTVNKAWGYADANCGQKFVFMCRNISEWQLPRFHAGGILHVLAYQVYMAP
jgi:hypothetical protein